MCEEENAETEDFYDNYVTERIKELREDLTNKIQYLDLEELLQVDNFILNMDNKY